MTAEGGERERAAVTCDGRLFHRRAAATGNTLSPTVDRRVCQTSRDVDESERSRCLGRVSVGRRSSSHRYGGSSHRISQHNILVVITVIIIISDT